MDEKTIGTVTNLDSDGRKVAVREKRNKDAHRACPNGDDIMLHRQKSQ